jgi:glutathione synthase
MPAARCFTHRVTAHEQRVCQVVKDKLIQDGLYFVGIDLIDGKLVEINCVSPGGIPRINRLNNVHLEKK